MPKLEAAHIARPIKYETKKSTHNYSIQISPARTLPLQLVAAANKGTLVIFVGAGASCGSPSNLPTFEGLVETIAKDFSNYDFQQQLQNKISLDLMLYDLQYSSSNVSIHDRIVDIISKIHGLLHTT